jgi:NAD+ synthetase
MVSASRRAQDQGADLVVFSELATTGYPPGDLLERDDFIDRNLDQLQRVAALSTERLSLVVGYVDRNLSGEGKKLYNAAALCRDGRVFARYNKALLPTYDVFDETRHFESGSSFTSIDYAGIGLGITVCEDAWTDENLWHRKLYRIDPVYELVSRGAQIMINISASPFSVGKGALRREVICRAAAEHGVPFVYVNQIGGNDELVFDGHSLLVDAAGLVVARACDFEEDLLVVEVPFARDPVELASGRTEHLRTVAGSEEEEAFRALVLGLRDYVSKAGFEKVLVGLSGGIDSALTAAVAQQAVGAENVTGVTMPTRYSSRGSVVDAGQLAENLGIDFREIPIDGVFQSFLDTLEPVFEGLPEDVTEENIQARVRGTVLMALSNKLGCLLLATGNKSELAVGYCTLYGDMCGGLAVLGDVPKTLVYRIARWLNRDAELIPEATINKPPSAELRPDQKDEDSLPSYDELDAVVESYVERHLSVREMVAEGLDEAVVRKIVRLIDISEHKRRQAPPVIRISTKAFGLGRRFPIVADYGELRRR